MSSIIIAGVEQNQNEINNKNDETYLYAKKWGKNFNVSFTQIPNSLIYCQGHLGLTDRELIILLQLISHWFRAERFPYPSQKRLGKYSGKCSSTVQRNLMNLELKGFLTRDERPGTSNMYDLIPCVYKIQDHIEECPNKNN